MSTHQASRRRKNEKANKITLTTAGLHQQKHQHDAQKVAVQKYLSKCSIMFVASNIILKMSNKQKNNVLCPQQF